jgi:hypothetical protein
MSEDNFGTTVNTCKDNISVRCPNPKRLNAERPNAECRPNAKQQPNAECQMPNLLG